MKLGTSAVFVFALILRLSQGTTAISQAANVVAQEHLNESSYVVDQAVYQQTPSFHPGPKSNLRSSIGLHKPDSLLKITQKSPSDIATMDIEARADVIGSLANDLTETLENDVLSVDLTEHPHLAESVEIARQAVEDVKKPLSDAMYYMRAAADEKDARERTVRDNHKNIKGRRPPPHEFMSQKSRRATESETTDHTHQDNYGSGDSRNSWREHYKPKASFGFQQHTSAHHHHARKIQEAVVSGNHMFLSEMLTGLHSRMGHFTGGQGHRRTQATKSQNCEQLATCARAMSLYDMFVYYFSDDINPQTGEVDDIVKGFDESAYNTDILKQGIEAKQIEIQRLSGILLTDGVNDSNLAVCDELLRQFHRSIEVNGNPEWEGAIVGQVCLAEGTTVFVKMDEALETLGMNYRDLDPDLDASFDSYMGGLFSILEPFAQEVLTCAEELFNALEDGRGEPFPFKNDAGDNVFPVSINQEGRDVHGRYTDVTQRAFTTQTYADIRAKYDACYADFVNSEFQDRVGECFSFGLGANFIDCLLPFISEALKECLPVYGEEIQSSIELVFGDRASVGFVCGIKDAVVNDGKSMPGECCLNAPYELEGDLWGYQYNCQNLETTCDRGPVLSGLSESSCKVYGGTFCPTTDCTDLKLCIEDEIEFGNTTGLSVYVEYLNSAPAIDDPTDLYACGRAREYFGFQSNFFNDVAICEDVQQLRFSSDFAFLDSFFNQGDKGGGGPGSSQCEALPADARVDCVPTIGLEPENRDTSGQPPATNGQAWRATNFALSKAVDTIFYALETVDAAKCPCDPLCVSDNVCAGVKTIIGTGLTILKFALDLAFEISAFTYAEVAELGNVEPIEIYESTQIIFGNMETMGNWLQDRFEYLYFETTCRPVEMLLPGHGCDGIVNLCDASVRVPDTCAEDIYSPEIDFGRVHELCGPNKHVFPTMELATQCVQDHVIATDDCYQVEATASPAGDSSPATCGNIRRVSVTASEVGACSKATTETFDVLVDSSANSYCQFSGSPDIAPSLDISSAVSQCSTFIMFSTIDAARACIEQHAVANDECRNVELLISSVSSSSIPPGCSTLIHDIEVTAKVAGCDLSTTKSMQVLVDSNLKTQSCAFLQGPDLDPILDMAKSIELCNNRVFATVDEAEDCVLGNSDAVDAAGNCRPIELNVATTNSNGLCEHQVVVTARVRDCDALTTTSLPINVIIDNQPPVPTCSFGIGEFLKPKGKLVDPELTYTVTENCGTEVSVQVEGFSNEKTIPHSDDMLLVYENATTSKVGWYVASESCHYHGGKGKGSYRHEERSKRSSSHHDDKSQKRSSSSYRYGRSPRGNHGNYDYDHGYHHHQSCIKDPAFKTRVYTARVTATDQAGLMGSTECQVTVKRGKGKGKGSMKKESKKSNRKLKDKTKSSTKEAKKGDKKGRDNTKGMSSKKSKKSMKGKGKGKSPPPPLMGEPSQFFALMSYEHAHYTPDGTNP